MGGQTSRQVIDFMTPIRGVQTYAPSRSDSGDEIGQAGNRNGHGVSIVAEVGFELWAQRIEGGKQKNRTAVH